MPVKTLSAAERQLLEQLIQELQSPAEEEAGVTKGQQLVRQLVKSAHTGNATTLANLLKMLEKLPPGTEVETSSANLAEQDWQNLFAFYGQYKTLINAEIAKRRKAHPDYWSFDWCKPTLKNAPWYEALYGKA